MQNKMQKRLLARALLKQQMRTVCFLSNADKPEAIFCSLHIEYLYRHKQAKVLFFPTFFKVLVRPVHIKEPKIELFHIF